MGETIYRPNVAAFVMDKKGNYLFCLRRDQKGHQVPQGGIKVGESSEDALRRELFEETGLTQYEIVKKAPETVKYKWNDDFTPNNPNHIGQEQIYFLIKIDEKEKSKLRESEEFIKFRWVKIDYLLENVADFKRDAVLTAWKLLNTNNK